jgi:uncharacterized protein YcbX
MEANAFGTVARIWRYPVKSLRAESLTAVHVGRDGLEGDRGTALHVSTPDRARTGKTYRGKENNLLHTTSQVETARLLAARRGLAVEALLDGPYFDAQPVSVLVDRWLHEAEALVGSSLDPLRYRPNFYVETARPCESEAAFVGRFLSIGSTQLRVVATILRCVTPTYDVVTGAANPAVLREVARRRANVMGVYCTVEREGEVALGNAVTAFAGPPTPSPT